jgi:hypothetical protein
MMKYLEDKINREILPFLKGYKKTWQFRFIQEMELDDKQKVAQTGAIRMGSITAGLGAGIPARLAYKIANDEALSKQDLEDLDEAKQNAMMAEMEGMGGDMEGNDDILGDQEQGRYGQGSEMYQPVNISDYGQGGENTEQRMGNKEEVEYQKSELQYEPGKVFYKSGKKYEIISNNGEFAKARIYVADAKDVPKGRSYKVGARGGIYYIGTLAEKQQGEGNKRMPRGTVEAQPKNGNGGSHGVGSAPASATNGQPKVPNQPHDTPFSDEGAKKMLEFFKGKLSKDVLNYGEEVSKESLYGKYVNTIEIKDTSFYKKVNSMLRAGKSDQDIKEIENIIDKSPPLPEGITMWRGIPNINSKNLQLNIGETIEDEAFQSHTLDPNVSRMFSEGNGIIIRAITSNKTKGVYIHKFNEITIQKGTKWKVVDKKQVNKNLSIVTVVAA